MTLFYDRPWYLRVFDFVFPWHRRHAERELRLYLRKVARQISEEQNGGDRADTP